MKCVKCGAQCLAESVGNGKIKYTCKGCGLSEVKDSQGRGLLTETTPTHGRGPLMG